MLPAITSDVKCVTLQKERKEHGDTGWSIPHAIPPPDKFPIVNRISSNIRIDPVRFIWRRVRGGHFSRNSAPCEDPRANCTTRDLEVAGLQAGLQGNRARTACITCIKGLSTKLVGYRPKPPPIPSPSQERPLPVGYLRIATEDLAMLGVNFIDLGDTRGYSDKSRDNERQNPVEILGDESGTSLICMLLSSMSLPLTTTLPHDHIHPQIYPSLSTRVTPG